MTISPTEMARREKERAATEARATAMLKTNARQHFSGTDAEFTAEWPDLLRALRADAVVTGMRNRNPIASLD